MGPIIKGTFDASIKAMEERIEQFQALISFVCRFPYLLEEKLYILDDGHWEDPAKWHVAVIQVHPMVII